MVEPVVVGRLQDVRVPYVLQDCFTARTSGILEVVQGRNVRRISFFTGEVRSARSNRLEQRVGQYLMRANAIDRLQLMRALSEGAPDGPIGHRLVAMGFLQEEQLGHHLQGLVREIVFDCCGWTSGDWRFYEGRPTLPIDLAIAVPTADLVFNGFKRFATEAMALEVIGDLSAPILPSPEMGILFSNLEMDQADAFVLTRLNGSSSAETLVASLGTPRAATLISIGAFIACGLASVRGQERRAHVQDFFARIPHMQPAAQPAGAEEIAPPTAPEQAPPTPKPAAPPPPINPRDLELIRRTLTEKMSILTYQPTHYDLLGVPIRATLKEIRTAYQHLAWTCDPETLERASLREYSRQASILMERLEESYRVLGDHNLRADYDRSLGHRRLF